MRIYQDTKAMARSLRASMAARSVVLSHSECLEIVAKQFGFVDWNTLSARMAGTAESDEVSCSFCGKSRHEVRSLIEGGCSSREVVPCTFICDECVTLCAQINTDTVDSAK